MKYELIKSSHFTKKASKLIKSNPELTLSLKQVLIQLSEDPFSIPLKTHKLKGQLASSLACSLNYQYRIIFKIIEEFELGNQISKVVFLETIGTHDEVY